MIYIYIYIYILKGAISRKAIDISDRLLYIYIYIYIYIIK